MDNREYEKKLFGCNLNDFFATFTQILTNGVNDAVDNLKGEMIKLNIYSESELIEVNNSDLIFFIKKHFNKSFKK